MARGSKSRSNLKATYFPKVVLLSTLIISIAILTLFLNKEGTSLDIREKAVYITPTTYQYTYWLNVEGCSVLFNADPMDSCEGRVTWYSRGLTDPRLYQRIGAAISYLESAASGERSFTLRNISPANCIQFALTDGNQVKTSKSVCIEIAPDCGLLPCP